MAVTAANDAPVCPDGNEESFGLLIRRGTSGSSSHGLFLRAAGFNIRLHTTASIPKEIKMDHARILVVSRVDRQNICS